MKAKRLALTASAILGFVAVPALAHHSIDAEYDRRQPVTLSGTVTKVTWNNPHVRLYMDARDRSGDVMMWQFEMASPNLLMLNGWKVDKLRPGDHVVVNAYKARRGMYLGYANKITLTTP
jgi:hypothetical protein